ncbi:hypothetical protein H6503_06065 [Candidatus Woesearchaeota archaeon]|nr:hypothetical protein [Candidatus Woesearchaeota archaeon]
MRSNLIWVILIFAVGWFSHDVISSINDESPSVISSQILFASNEERASPSDIIPEDKIHVLNDKIIIEVENPEWAKFTDTNSMDPVFDIGANALQIVPESYKQIGVGDIISFSTSSGVIIHRVIETGIDDDGWYARTKGDNNAYADPGKVRFDQVKKLLIGVIY